MSFLRLPPGLTLCLAVIAFASGPEARAQSAPVPGIGAHETAPPEPGPSDSWTLTEFNANWGNSFIGQQEALRLGLTGAGTLVAVLDNGMAATFNNDGSFAWIDPEIAGRLSPLSRYFAQGPPDFRFRPPNLTTAAFNELAHGAHVMGTIGAAANGSGMMGIAPGASLIGLRTIVPGLQDADAFAKAASWGLSAGARVFNASLGPVIADGASTWGLSPEHVWQLVGVRRILEAGGIFVAAAGNDGGFAPASANPVGLGLVPFIRPENHFDPSRTADPLAGVNVYDFNGTLADMLAATADPVARAELLRGTNFSDYASLPGRLIAVVNIDRNGAIWTSSNHCGVAAAWCIAAPGRRILSTVNPSVDEDPDGNIIVLGSNYLRETGTSMAAPHVAGALAVLMEAYPRYTARQIVDLLFDTTQDLGAPGIDPVFGRGLIRLDWALQGPRGLDPFALTAYTATLNADTRWRMSVLTAGGLIKSGSGALILDAARSYVFGGAVSVTGGALQVNGALSASALTIGPGGALTGSGLITAPAQINGLLSPGASPGALVFAAPVTLGPAALTHLEIDGTNPAGGAGGFDRIIITGAGNGFAANGTLRPVTRGITPPANNNFTPPIGASLRVIEAQGGVTGSFTALTQPLSGLPAGARFDVIYRNTAIDLVVTPQAFAPFAASPHQQDVAAALDAARPAAGTRPGASVKGLFDALYGGAVIPTALDQLSGLNRARTIAAAVSAASTLSQFVAASTAPGVWGASFAGTAALDPRDGRAGHDTDTFGFATGVNAALAQNFSAGLTVAQVEARVSAQGLRAATVRLTSAGLTATYQDQSIALMAQAGYLAGDAITGFDLTALQPGASGASRARIEGAFAALGAESVVARDEDGFRLVALGALEGVTLTLAGAPLSPEDLGLRAKDQTATRVTSRLGARLLWQFDSPFHTGEAVVVEDEALVPSLSLAWAHDWMRTQDAELSLGGQNFVSALPRAGRDALEVSGALAFHRHGAFTAVVAGDAAFARGETRYSLSASLSLRF